MKGKNYLNFFHYWWPNDDSKIIDTDSVSYQYLISSQFIPIFSKGTKILNLKNMKQNELKVAALIELN